MAPIQSLLCGTLSIFTLLKFAAALPRPGPYNAANAHIKRDAAAIATSYDYIIVGGGTSGLTVADRLTEDSSSTRYRLRSEGFTYAMLIVARIRPCY
jgi:hypothetical protein